MDLSPWKTVRMWWMFVFMVSPALSIARVSPGNRLINSLMRNYSSIGVQSPPVGDSQGPLVVEIGMELIRINSVNMQEQWIDTTLVLIQKWNDSYIKWDPARFGGVEHIRVPPRKIWKPDVMISNTMSGPQEELVSQMDVNSVGAVTWSVTSQPKTICSMDMEYFPFDRQVCEIRVTTSVYSDEVKLSVNTDSSYSLADFIGSTAWDLWDISHHTRDHFEPDKVHPKTDVIFRLKLRRRGLLGTYLLVPVVMVTILSLLVFLVDPMEKFTVGLVICLAKLALAVWLVLQGPQGGIAAPRPAVFLIVVGCGYGAVLLLYAGILTIRSCTKPCPAWLTQIFKYLSVPVCASDACPCAKSNGNPDEANIELDESKPDAKENKPKNKKKDWELVAKTLGRWVLLIYVIFILLVAFTCLRFPYEL